MIESVATWWMWLGFFTLIFVMITADLQLLGGKLAHRVSLREAVSWSIVWVSVALLFNGLLWWYLHTTAGAEIAREKALEFLTGYLIEKALAADNIFVWLLIFHYFKVPAEYQRRVLLYGVIGAIVMRTAMIIAGTWLISTFHWVLYLFGIFLVITGFRMLFLKKRPVDFASNPVLQWVQTHCKVTHQFQGERFFILQDGVRYVTPLFLVLVLVEISDLIFAVDSIPAIFAITMDPFIVLTSNVFAILGLRAMYFLLKDMADRFSFLKYGLGIVLMFVGTKMLIADFFTVPVHLSLAVIGIIIAASIFASTVWKKRMKGSDF